MAPRRVARVSRRIDGWRNHLYDVFFYIPKNWKKQIFFLKNVSFQLVSFIGNLTSHPWSGCRYNPSQADHSRKKTCHEVRLVWWHWTKSQKLGLQIGGRRWGGEILGDLWYLWELVGAVKRQHLGGFKVFSAFLVESGPKSMGALHKKRGWTCTRSTNGWLVLKIGRYQWQSGVLGIIYHQPNAEPSLFQQEVGGKKENLLLFVRDILLIARRSSEVVYFGRWEWKCPSTECAWIWGVRFLVLVVGGGHGTWGLQMFVDTCCHCW